MRARSRPTLDWSQSNNILYSHRIIALPRGLTLMQHQ